MNPNNGLITKIWGPPLWIAFHSMTFGFPLNPTDEDKKNYRQYFVNIANVLPCGYCRDSYKIFITTGNTELTDTVFASRKALTYWGFLLHERVNDKLSVTYGTTYEEVVDRYESYRAQCSIVNANGCIVPLDYKKFSYQHYYFKDTQLIPKEVAIAFGKMASIRKFPSTYLAIHQLIIDNLNNLPVLKKTRLWRIRNHITNTVIMETRLSGQPCIESEGEWKDYPAISEVALMIFASTSMEHDLWKSCYQKWIQDVRFKQELT
jgi:hypothetical protein